LCAADSARIANHDGAFAEYLALPLENLHVVPKNVMDEQAVFVERSRPLAKSSIKSM